eukprot:CAMPEP_0177680972 /NCGR_PEP_ID=MMETSP0447-20121125/30458_1 /TAXON_ID=0 /ORGANISM="Stygamoeba regulata, Strain BSH-02190019" /LENGTH=369 /DNA_ID=CAMNT_0019190339 /DNA_START=424 /DNA_END=1533 /DNA_ORIENTATION=+
MTNCRNCFNTCLDELGKRAPSLRVLLIGGVFAVSKSALLDLISSCPSLSLVNVSGNCNFNSGSNEDYTIVQKKRTVQVVCTSHRVMELSGKFCAALDASNFSKAANRFNRLDGLVRAEASHCNYRVSQEGRRCCLAGYLVKAATTLCGHMKKELDLPRALSSPAHFKEVLHTTHRVLALFGHAVRDCGMDVNVEFKPQPGCAMRTVLQDMGVLWTALTRTLEALDTRFSLQERAAAAAAPPAHTTPDSRKVTFFLPPPPPIVGVARTRLEECRSIVEDACFFACAEKVAATFAHRGTLIASIQEHLRMTQHHLAHWSGSTQVALYRDQLRRICKEVRRSRPQPPRTPRTPVHLQRPAKRRALCVPLLCA